MQSEFETLFKDSMEKIDMTPGSLVNAEVIEIRNDYIVIAGKGNENDILYKNHVVKHNDLKVLKARLK